MALPAASCVRDPPGNGATAQELQKNGALRRGQVGVPRPAGLSHAGWEGSQRHREVLGGAGGAGAGWVQAGWKREQW